MSARSCLLCGKPLSRIWVGAGGDFCSREHRNQYRLRQGMDRLQEANKVASVMRRREHLRPLSRGRLSNPSSPSPHGFFDRRFVAVSTPALPARLSMQLTAPRMTSRPDAFIPPKAAVSPGAPPQMAARQGFDTLRSPGISLLRIVQPPVRMSQAPPVDRPRAAMPVRESRREFSMLRPSGQPSIRCRRTMLQPEVQLPAARRNGAGARPIPVRGNALRVSSACGFRARGQRVAFTPIAIVKVAKLRWTQRPHTPAAHAPERVAARACDAIAYPQRAVFCPAAPAPPGSGLRLARRTMRLEKPPAPRGASPNSRPAPPSWEASADGIALRAPVFRHWKPGPTDPRPTIVLRPASAMGRGLSRYTLAPFVPQDVSCGYPFNLGSKDHQR
jgi:hypothetical protein